MCDKTYKCFGENTVRLMVSKSGHSHCYFLNVSGAEFLDVARGLWCMGANYISAYGVAGSCNWHYDVRDARKDAAMRRKCRGGYSSEET